MDYLGEMEFQKALGIFKALQEQHPQDANLTRLVFRAAKADPSSEDYHRAALKLLARRTWTPPLQTRRTPCSRNI